MTNGVISSKTPDAIPSSPKPMASDGIWRFQLKNEVCQSIVAKESKIPCKMGI
jgi:hypothetical protein